MYLLQGFLSFRFLFFFFKEGHEWAARQNAWSGESCGQDRPTLLLGYSIVAVRHATLTSSSRTGCLNLLRIIWGNSVLEIEEKSGDIDTTPGFQARYHAVISVLREV